MGNPVSSIDPFGLDTLVIVGERTNNNPFGHVALAFTDKGVYSSGTDTKLASSTTAYLAKQATYRNTNVYRLKTTPEQEAKMIAEYKKLSRRDMPNARLHPLEAYSDTCATRAQKALAAGGITSILVPHVSPFPGDTALIAIWNGGKRTYIPEHGKVPVGFDEFNPK